MCEHIVAEKVCAMSASNLKFDPEACSEEMGRRNVNLSQRVRAMAVRLKRELFALHLAAGDPRTPWYAKAFVACVVAYAF